MLKRFISFYKPYKALFTLDVTSSALHAVFALMIPFFTRGIFKGESGILGEYPLYVSVAIILVTIILLACTAFINDKWGHILGSRIENNMRKELFRHLQKLSFSYFDNTKTGHIVSRMSNDLTSISELAHHGPEDLLLSTLMIIGSISIMFSFSTTLTFAALLPLAILLAWAIIFGSRMRNKFRTVRKRIADINSSVENSIQGIREVKSYANEDYAIEKFGEANMGFLSAKEDMYKVMAKFHSGMIFFIESYQLVVIGTSAYLVRKGELDLADVIAFLMYFRFSMMPIRKLVNFIEQFQQGVAAFERFDEVMEVEPDIIDKENPVVLNNVEGNIDFKDVSFKYEGCDEWILEDINIKIDKGKTIALVGESGAGKSSLASLIPRFYEVQKGTISLDGINIMDLEQKTLRENIGIVQQNIFLFDTTIRENIMFGNPEATEEELVLAAKSANIFDYIMTLPDQFETVVGERGVKLSGGQKQRISIARAFLKNPPVLIFDEATSSLDTESESLITDSMEKLCENRTTIIIAHRLSTVRNADYTYVLKSGKIIEHGPHEDLIKSEGYYKSLYTKSMF